MLSTCFGCRSGRLQSCDQSKVTPTHLVCYQQGVRIVDAETIDGMMMKRVSLGGAAVLAWVWEDESGVQYLTYSETVSCQDSPLP